MRAMKTISMAMGAVVLAAAGLYALPTLSADNKAEPLRTAPPAPRALPAPPASMGQVQLTFAPVVRRIAPAVVNVYSKSVVQAQVNPFANDPFFSQFFGGGGRSGARTSGRSRGGAPRGFSTFDFDTEPQRAPDLRAEAGITLLDAIKGAKRRLDLVGEDECATCGGSGVIAREEKQGKARVIRAAEQCPTCGGAGVVAARRTLEVSIPAGVSDGTQLRLKGQGGRAPRPDQNGDLFLTIRIEPNPVFAIAGRDLRVNLPVWDYEAALGAEITAPTVDGRVALKIPAGSQAGRVMRLRGRGLPARGKEPAGDLLYELKVLAPTELNAKERGLMQQLADSLKDRGVADPRAELMASK